MSVRWKFWLVVFVNLVVVPALGAGLGIWVFHREPFVQDMTYLPIILSGMLTPLAFKYWVKHNNKDDTYTWQKSIILSLTLAGLGGAATYGLFVFIFIVLLDPHFS